MSRNYEEMKNQKLDRRNGLLVRSQLLIPSWDQGRPVGVYNI